MQSIATHHFPQVVWRKKERWLWNPIRKQALKNRPEERVRLRIIDALIAGGWSRHRISTEESIPSPNTALRTDVICYDKAFNPQILVECKAENISISTQTAEQIARYNTKVGAPHILLTNGVRDFWYKVTDKSAEPLNGLPDMLSQHTDPENQHYSYWSERGFAGTRAMPALRQWLTHVLPQWVQPRQKPDTPPTYLHFKQPLNDLELSHYYRVYTFDSCKIALGFVATAYGGSRLTAILNQNAANKAVAEINLDLLAGRESPNATLYSDKGSENFDAAAELSLDISNPENPDPDILPERFEVLFHSKL